MRLLRNDSLAYKIAAANPAGLASLAAILIGLYHYTLSAYADAQAQQELAKAVKVAWEQVRHQGKTFRLLDGKLTAGETERNGRYEIVDGVQALVGGVATGRRGRDDAA